MLGPVMFILLASLALVALVNVAGICLMHGSALSARLRTRKVKVSAGFTLAPAGPPVLFILRGDDPPVQRPTFAHCHVDCPDVPA